MEHMMEMLMELEQFDSAVLLGAFMEAELDGMGDAEAFRLYVRNGHCMYENEEYLRAVRVYEIACERAEHESAVPREDYCDILFRIAKAHRRMRDYPACRNALERIPENYRTVPHLVMLGGVYETLGLAKLAAAVYRGVLSERCNFVFDVMVRLINLGETPAEVMRLYRRESIREPDIRRGEPQENQDGTRRGTLRRALVPAYSLPQWLYPFTEGLHLMKKHRFSNGAAVFQKLETLYGDNLPLLEYVAVNDVYSDNLASARKTFQRILRLDPDYISSMDTYGSVLKKLSLIPELRQLSRRLMRTASHRRESWSTASILHAAVQPKQYQAVVALVDKALSLDPTYWFGYVQKGWVLLRQGMNVEALGCFRRALQISDNVFAYTGVVRAKLARNENAAATDVANACFKKYSLSPIALALLGNCLSRFPEGHEKAAILYRNALKLDKHSIDAIAGITELLVVEEKFDEVVEILEKHLEYGRHMDLLHTRLAEVYHLSNHQAKALEHYNAALSINPNLEVAKEGLEVLLKDADEEDTMDNGQGEGESAAGDSSGLLQGGMSVSDFLDVSDGSFDLDGQ